MKGQKNRPRVPLSEWAAAIVDKHRKDIEKAVKEENNAAMLAALLNVAGMGAPSAAAAGQAGEERGAEVSE